MEKKMTRSEKMRFVRNLIRLKQQGEFIENSIETFVMGMKLNVNVIQDLIETRRQCVIERRETIDPLYRSALEVSDDLDNVKSTIDQFQEGKKIDPKEIKSMLLSLSKKFDEFKFDEELEALRVEQKEIEDYLHEFRAKIEKYEKTKSAVVNYNALLSNKKQCEATDYDGIGDFDALVAKTGHAEHWKEEDHLFFLKIRKKSQSVPAMVLDIQKVCPDLTAREIVNHEAWYKIYLDLREKQRKSVKEWRKRREMEKKEKVKSLKNNGDEEKNNLAKKLVKNQGNNLELSDENHLKFCKISKAKICEEKKEMIKKWKIEKENAKIVDEERLKTQNEGLRSWKEQQFFLRNIEIKAALDEYRVKKMQQEFSKKQNKKKNKIVKSPGLIKSFRRQDQTYLRNRRIILNSKNKNDDSAKSTTSPMRSRSGSTLMKPTKIWKERCKQRLTPEQSSKEVMYIKNLPKLSTFNWKNQESIISL